MPVEASNDPESPATHPAKEATAGKKKRGKGEKRPRYRRDLDRDTHMKRLRPLLEELGDCPYPSVPLALEAMRRTHEDFEAARSRIHARRADWRKARRHFREQEALAYKAVLHVAEELRQKPQREWDGKAPDTSAQRARLEHLLNGQVPTQLRRTADLLISALRRLDRIFTKDPAEAARWSARFVSAVGPLARTLKAAQTRDNQTRFGLREAMGELQATREWWDHAWEHARQTIARFVERFRGDPRLLEAFRPVRYRARPKDEGAATAEGSGDAA